MVRYLIPEEVAAMNEEILGQVCTVRDPGGLESAVMRPQTVAYYENADLETQAAFYFMGIAVAHAFIDGNKRAALAAGTAFLYLNGFQVITLPEELGQQIEDMVNRSAASLPPLPLFLEWLRPRIQPLPLPSDPG